jgi:hypothetical protein
MFSLSAGRLCLRVKTDRRPAAGLAVFFNELPDCAEDDRELFIMIGHPRLEIAQLAGQRIMSGQQFAQTDEDPHDFNADGHGSGRLEDRREHGHTLFGEGVRRVTPAARSYSNQWAGRDLSRRHFSQT